MTKTPTIDPLNHTKQVINLGNVELSKVSASDPAISHDCGGGTELGVGQAFSCKGMYSLSWEDVGAGTKQSAAT